MEHPVPQSPQQKVISTEDRRRYRRVEVAWEIAVESIHRVEWPGEIVSFGPFGMKLRVEAKGPGPSEGNVVRLKFAPAEGEPLLSLEGIVCRVDPDGLAVTFVNLSAHVFQRLKSLVDTLLGETV